MLAIRYRVWFSDEREDVAFETSTNSWWLGKKKKFGAMAYFWVISSDIGWVITVHHQHSEVEWLWKQLDSFVVCHLLIAFFLPDRVQRSVYFEHNDQWKHHINLFICNNLWTKQKGFYCTRVRGASNITTTPLFSTLMFARVFITSLLY